MFQRFEYESIRETTEGAEFYLANTGTEPWAAYVDGVYAEDGECRVLTNYQQGSHGITVLVGNSEIGSLPNAAGFSLSVKLCVGNRVYWCGVYHKQPEHIWLSNSGILLDSVGDAGWRLSKGKSSLEPEAIPFCITEIRQQGNSYLLRVEQKDESIVFGKAALAGQVQGRKERILFTEFQEFGKGSSSPELCPELQQGTHPSPLGRSATFLVNLGKLGLREKKDSYIEFYLCYLTSDEVRHYRRMGYSGTGVLFQNSHFGWPCVEYFYPTSNGRMTVKRSFSVLLALEEIQIQEGQPLFIWRYHRQQGEKIKEIRLSSPSACNEFPCHLKVREEIGNDVVFEMAFGREVFTGNGFQASLYGVDAVVEYGLETMLCPVYLKGICLKNGIEPLFGTELQFVADGKLYSGILAANKSGMCQIDIWEESHFAELKKLEIAGEKMVIEGELHVSAAAGAIQEIYLQDSYGGKAEIPYGTKELGDGKLQFCFSLNGQRLCSLGENDYFIIVSFAHGYSRLSVTFPRISGRNRATCFPVLDIDRDGKYGFSLQCAYEKNFLRVRVFCKPLLFISGVTSSYGKILFQCTSVKGAEQLHLQRAILRNKVTEQEEEVKLEGQGKVFQLIIHKRKLSKLTCGEYLLLLYPEEGAELRVSALREEKELWKGVNEKKGWDIKLPGKNQVSLKVDKKNVAYISIREKGRPEGFLDKWKVTCAKLLAKIYRRVQKEPVWLIGEEMGRMAQDNGYAFFQYCIKEKKRKHAYYVTQKRNPDLDRVCADKKFFVLYGSVRHIMLHFVCDYYIVAHGIKDVMPPCFHDGIKNNKKPVIYLQHGITGMERVKFKGNYYNSTIKRVIVSSQQEKQICLRYMQFREEQVAVTGLARFDGLRDLSEETRGREILIMPTWRDWSIDSREAFRKSLFYQNYKKLLENQALHQELREHNVCLVFYPHLKIREGYLDMFQPMENDVVKIAGSGTATVAERLKRADMLITDYSSVAFDFASMGKPVCFFQFDKDEYLRNRGTYVSFEQQLPGEIAEGIEELLERIREYVEQDFQPKELYMERLKKFVDFADRRNCERIYESIISLKR